MHSVLVPECPCVGGYICTLRMMMPDEIFALYKCFIVVRYKVNKASRIPLVSAAVCLFVLL